MLHEPRWPREWTASKQSRAQHASQQHVIVCFDSAKTNVDLHGMVDGRGIHPIPIVQNCSLDLLSGDAVNG